MSQDFRHATVGRVVTAKKKKKGLLTMEATVKVVSRDPVPDVGREHLQSETKDKMKTERGRGVRCTGSPGQCQTS